MHHTETNTRGNLLPKESCTHDDKSTCAAEGGHQTFAIAAALSASEASTEKNSSLLRNFSLASMRMGTAGWLQHVRSTERITTGAWVRQTQNNKRYLIGSEWLKNNTT